MPIAGSAAALSIRVVKHSSDVESIQWRSSTTNRIGRRCAPLRMSWRSASKVRALTAEVVSAASASVPSEMPNRRKRYGTAPAGSIPTSWSPAPDLGGDGVRAVALGDAEVRPEDVEDREVRDGAGVGLAPPLQERHPLLGLAEQPLAKLVEQARFPDAGLAEQARRPDRGPGARPRVGSTGVRAPGRGPRTSAAAGRDRSPGRSGATSRCTGPIAPAPPTGREVEVAREEGRRRLLDEDRAGLGESEERVEHRPRLALAVQVDLGAAAGGPDEHPPDGDPRVDPDRLRPRRRWPAPRPCAPPSRPARPAAGRPRSARARTPRRCPSGSSPRSVRRTSGSSRRGSRARGSG